MYGGNGEIWDLDEEFTVEAGQHGLVIMDPGGDADACLFGLYGSDGRLIKTVTARRRR